MLSRGSYGVIHTSKMAGYRATPGGAALWLETSDGRELFVTVPDAATAAALVNTALDRRRTVLHHHTETGPDRC